MPVKPANVPSFGARSGGVGSFASADATSPSAMADDGNAACSLPDAILTPSGAVSAARSRSIDHLNLSQPLGSSAAKAGTIPSNSNPSSKGMRISVHRDHHIGRLDHHRDLPLRLDAEVVDRLVGDRGGHDRTVADVDTDVGRRGALRDFDDRSLDLVACTDAHGLSQWLARATKPHA